MDSCLRDSYKQVLHIQYHLDPETRKLRKMAVVVESSFRILFDVFLDRSNEEVFKLRLGYLQALPLSESSFKVSRYFLLVFYAQNQTFKAGFHLYHLWKINYDSSIHYHSLYRSMVPYFASKSHHELKPDRSYNNMYWLLKGEFCILRKIIYSALL